MRKQQIKLSGIIDSYQVVRPSSRHTFLIPFVIGLIFMALVVFFLGSGDPAEEQIAENTLPVTESDLISSTESTEARAEEISVPHLLSSTETPSQEVTEEEINAIIDSNAEAFTDWMTVSDLDAFIKILNSGYEKSFWDRGHWIIAVEGRWQTGSNEYRIAYEKMRNPGVQWKYKINQSQSDFSRNLDLLSRQGYRLVFSQSFKRPDQTQRFQAVWQHHGGDATNSTSHGITSSPPPTVGQAAPPVSAPQIQVLPPMQHLPAPSRSLGTESIAQSQLPPLTAPQMTERERSGNPRLREWVPPTIHQTPPSLPTTPPQIHPPQPQPQRPLTTPSVVRVRRGSNSSTEITTISRGTGSASEIDLYEILSFRGSE